MQSTFNINLRREPLENSQPDKMSLANDLRQQTNRCSENMIFTGGRASMEQHANILV